MCILCLLLASTGWGHVWMRRRQAGHVPLSYHLTSGCLPVTRECESYPAPVSWGITVVRWLRYLAMSGGSSLVGGAAGSAASSALSCWCLPVLRLKFTRGCFLLRSFGSPILIHRCCSGPWSLGILPFSFPNVLHTWTVRNSFIPKILSPF